MARRLACTAALALILAPAASADGPSVTPGVMEGWTGITAPGLPFRWVTLSTGRSTVVQQIRRSTGRVFGFNVLPGGWGIPMVASDGSVGGLSRNGRFVVLADANRPRTLAKTTRLLLVSTRTLSVFRRITLRGDFAFDALSPDGRTIFLIQHLSQANLTRYRVRAYDLTHRRLLPQVIADRRQAGWVMQGQPVTRSATTDGRWAYTLYQKPGGYPFIHALDTVRNTATCIGIPWHGNQAPLFSSRLKLNEHTGKLTIQTYDGRPMFTVDTRTFWVSRPASARSSRFPVTLLAISAAGGLALLLLGLIARRRARLITDRTISAPLP